MRKSLITLAVAGALLGSAGAMAQQDYRLGDAPFTFRVAPAAPEWTLNADEGQCRLRVWVDDRAQVQLRGDQIVVNTIAGRRSFDQGSVCTQPLPFHHVDDLNPTAKERISVQPFTSVHVYPSLVSKVTGLRASVWTKSWIVVQPGRVASGPPRVRRSSFARKYRCTFGAIVQ